MTESASRFVQDRLIRLQPDQPTIARESVASDLHDRTDEQGH